MTQCHLIAGAFDPAIEAPWPAMGALDLGVQGHAGARPHDPLDAKAAAAAARASGVGDQRITLDHEGKLGLGLLVRAVVGVAVVDAHGRADAVLAALGAPASSERPEIGDEELGGLRV